MFRIIRQLAGHIASTVRKRGGDEREERDEKERGEGEGKGERGEEGWGGGREERYMVLSFSSPFIRCKGWWEVLSHLELVLPLVGWVFPPVTQSGNPLADTRRGLSTR